MEPQHTSFIAEIAAYSTAALGVLVGAIHKMTHKRIDEVQMEMRRKADQEEMNKISRYIERIFEKLDAHLADETTWQAKIVDQMNRNHVEILYQLNKKADK